MLPAQPDEVFVTIGDVPYGMRLGFAAAIKLEKALGCSLLELAQRIGQARVSIGDIAAVLHAGIGGKLTFDQVGDAIMDAGVMPMAKPASELVMVAITGGKKPQAADAEKKDQPA